MQEVSGMLRVGEAKATVAAIARRQRGSLISYYAILAAFCICGAALGVLVGFILSQGSQRDLSLGGALGLIAGSLTYSFFGRHIAMSRFKSRFKQRQHTLDLPLRIAIAEPHLTYELGGVTQLAQWAVVDELIRSHEYWIFMVQTSVMFFAPRRMFTGEDQERLFIQQAISFMSEDARTRSVEAARLAGS